MKRIESEFVVKERSPSIFNQWNTTQVWLQVTEAEFNSGRRIRVPAKHPLEDTSYEADTRRVLKSISEGEIVNGVLHRASTNVWVVDSIERVS